MRKCKRSYVLLAACKYLLFFFFLSQMNVWSSSKGRANPSKSLGLDLIIDLMYFMYSICFESFWSTPCLNTTVSNVLWEMCRFREHRQHRLHWYAFPSSTRLILIKFPLECPWVLFHPLTLWSRQGSDWCRTIQPPDIPFQLNKGRVKGNRSASS